MRSTTPAPWRRCVAGRPAIDPEQQRAAPGSGAPTTRQVDYKGGPLDSEKGPGLGCFWLQVVLLVVVIFLAPLSAAWNWPIPIIIVLFAATIVLLLFVGQTVIFLLRLVAADRRAAGRRRPMRSATRTVGEIEDATAGEPAEEASVRPDADLPSQPDAGIDRQGGMRE